MEKIPQEPEFSVDYLETCSKFPYISRVLVSSGGEKSTNVDIIPKDIKYTISYENAIFLVIKHMD